MATIQCGHLSFCNVQAIIFDKDGTLANSESFLQKLGQQRSYLLEAQLPGIQEQLLQAFGLRGQQVDPAGLLAVGSRRDSEIAAAAYITAMGPSWVESLAIVHAAFLEADYGLKPKANFTPLVSGGLHLLQALVAAGVKVGILSSDTTENVREFVQKYQLQPYVQLQMGTTEGRTKPDPVLLQQACQALNTDLGSTIVIGDSDADIVMAHAAGAMGCIGVTWGWSTPVYLPKADALATQPMEIHVAQ